MASSLQGIQRVAKSNFELLPYGAKIDGWNLPGRGEAYADCGHKLVFGCLDVESHSQARIDGVDVVGKVFVKLKKRSCLRAQCPVCYEKWAAKEAHKMTYRLNQWKGSGRVIHVTLSPPRSEWYTSLEALRSTVYKLAKEIGVFGGSCVVHPFRQTCIFCGSNKDVLTERCSKCGCSQFSWIYSPHYHLLAYGWIHGEKVKAIYDRTGWISKNHGVRGSVEGTAFYELSHAGIKEGIHTVTWFGRLAYNVLRVTPEPEEKEVCPLCASIGIEKTLDRILWVGPGELPYDDEGEYFDDPDHWVKGWSGYG
jgi:hypothetical protein